MYKKFSYQYIPTRNIYIVNLIGNDNFNYTFMESIYQKSKIDAKFYRSILEQYNAIYPDTLVDPIFKVPYFENKEDIINCIEKLNSILMITILKED